jgi:hypothetical protein
MAWHRKMKSDARKTRAQRRVGVQSFERGLALLRAFGAERAAMTTAEAANAAGLTRAGARDVPFNGRPLEAGELYAVEPGLYVPGVGGFRCADVVLVEARAQRLPAPPKDIASCTVI